MTNPCNDILRKNGLTPDEQNLIEIMSRQGDNTPAIRENFFKAIEPSSRDNPDGNCPSSQKQDLPVMLAPKPRFFKI